MSSPSVAPVRAPKRPLLYGAQRPQRLLLPHPADRVRSSGPEVVELAENAGLFLDPWQQLALECALWERPSEEDDALWEWAAFEVGLVVPRQNGKGPEDQNARVLTTDGWTTFRDIRAGQHVYGPDGKPTEVVAVSPVYPAEQCYRVRFTDGAERVVGAGHLWHVYDRDASGGSRTAKSGRWVTMSTETIAAKRWGWQRGNGRMEYRFRVRCDAVPDTPTADLPVDPYLLGYWLGDGKYDAAEITCHADELPHLRARVAAAGGVVTRECLAHGDTWRIGFSLERRGARGGFLPRIKALGVYGNKHIPDVYLTASIEQRRALLAGLVDSDGSVANTNKSSQVELSSSYPALAAGIHRLLRSLGVRVTPKEGKTSFNGQAYRMRTRFLWTPTFNPFSLPRKANAVRLGESRRQEVMSITGVTPTPSVPTRCIQVAHPSGVYLTGELFTPTHNSTLEARELAGLFLFEEDLILHSAHEFKTSGEAFRRVHAVVENNSWMLRKVASISTAHGNEGIELKPTPVIITGSAGAFRTGGRVCRLRFVARTGGSARGFTANLVVWDEAFNLPEGVVGAQLPTLSAVRNPQLWYTSSAVDKDVHPYGMTLARVRARALREIAAAQGQAVGGDGAAPDAADLTDLSDPDEFGGLAWLEWSADEDAYRAAAERSERAVRELLARRDQWALANPGLGFRLRERKIAKELRAMGAKTFAVERLGLGDWPVVTDEAGRVDMARWAELVDPDTRPAGKRIALGVEVSLDGRTAAIASASKRVDGAWHVKVTDHRPGGGTGWVVPRIKDLCGRYDVAVVLLNPTTPAGALLAPLTDAGVEPWQARRPGKGGVRTLSMREYAAACGEFVADVLDRGELGQLAKRVRHAGQSVLDDALREAGTRNLAEAWAWDQKASTADITPLVAVTEALHGFRVHGSEKGMVPWGEYL